MSWQQHDILYLSQYYLPTSAAAGIRAERQVNALIDRGLRVAIVTSGDRACLERLCPNRTICRIDPLGRLPDGLPTSDILVWPRRDPLPGPDHSCAYVKSAFVAGQAMVHRYRPRLIYVTGTPFSLLAVANQLGRMFNLPVIYEFRDAWYTGGAWPYVSGLRRRQARLWEVRCVEDAAAIVTGTETIKKILDQRFGAGAAQKIFSITHSYDPIDSGDPDRGVDIELSSGNRKDKMTIVYTGQLRGLDLVDQPVGRRVFRWTSQQIRRLCLGANFCERLRLDWMSPHYVMKAIAELCRESPQIAQKIRLIFVGRKYPQIDAWASQFNLTTQVEQRGFVCPEEARRIARQADVLLIYLYGIKGLDYHWCVPSKIYTYLGAAKPILAPIPAGETKDLITDAGVGYFADPDDIGSIAQQIKALFQMHQNGGIKLKPDWRFIRQYELAVQQEQYANLVLSLLKKPQSQMAPEYLCVE